MHDYTSSIPDRFSYRTHCHDACEEIGLIFHPQKELDHCAECENSNEEGIQAKVGSVPVDGILNQTLWGHFSAVLGYAVTHIVAEM